MYRYYTDKNPQEVTPNSTEYIMTGILRNGEFNFYILPQTLVYLDYSKYLRECYPNDDPETFVDENVEERFYIYTVDEEHEDYFMECIQPYRREGQRLREEMQMCIADYEVSYYFPCVLIDFDRKKFLCYYWEPYFWEKYLPEGWISEFRPITDEDVPADKRFWLDEEGRDMFSLLYDELEKEE